MTDLETLASIKSIYLAALRADALRTPFGPPPDYSLDGQTVSREQWREGLWKKIKDINELLQMEDPFEFHGQVM